MSKIKIGDKVRCYGKCFTDGMGVFRGEPGIIEGAGISEDCFVVRTGLNLVCFHVKQLRKIKPPTFQKGDRVKSKINGLVGTVSTVSEYSACYVDLDAHKQSDGSYTTTFIMNKDLIKLKVKLKPPTFQKGDRVKTKISGFVGTVERVSNQGGCHVALDINKSASGYTSLFYSFGDLIKLKPKVKSSNKLVFWAKVHLSDTTVTAFVSREAAISSAGSGKVICLQEK